MYTQKLIMLNDTLDILRKGYYTLNGVKRSLKLSGNEMKEVKVFLPNDIAAIREGEHKYKRIDDTCIYTCENMDSFSMARKVVSDVSLCPSGKPGKVLVLNFANPVNPGGGVRRGASAQEEDLCRKSSLLLSLEGENAEGYYEYNRSLRSYLASDAVIITPNVEIIKDEKGELLRESVVVAVMTCAAPMITRGLEGLDRERYIDLFYNRIMGILHCAAYLEYEYLVLGAFGCGAFGNDARPVSDMFYIALNAFRDLNGGKDAFKRVDFAVLSNHREMYNFEEFSRNFGKCGAMNRR